MNVSSSIQMLGLTSFYSGSLYSCACSLPKLRSKSKAMAICTCHVSWRDWTIHDLNESKFGLLDFHYWAST